MALWVIRIILFVVSVNLFLSSCAPSSGMTESPDHAQSTPAATPVPMGSPTESSPIANNDSGGPDKTDSEVHQGPVTDAPTDIQTDTPDRVRKSPSPSTSGGAARSSLAPPARSAPAVASDTNKAEYPEEWPPLEDSKTYDESIRHPSVFSINQNNRRLEGLFSSKGRSELCGPVALANVLIYQKLWSEHPVTDLQLPAADENFVEVVRPLAKMCKTDADKGTGSNDLRNCWAEFYAKSGYPNTNSVQVIKNVSLDDVRNFVSRDDGVILQIGWYRWNAKTHSWEREGGHFVSLVGFDYDREAGDAKIQLRILNPQIDYMKRPEAQRYDLVDMKKIEFKSGVQYPEGSTYQIEGPGFRFAGRRAYVRFLIVGHPSR
jgi:hypothetical protein